MLTTGNFRDWQTVVRQILRHLVLETSVDRQSKLIQDPLQDVQPMYKTLERQRWRAQQSASECSRFWTYLRFWPPSAAKQFKSYYVNKHTHTPTDKHYWKHTIFTMLLLDGTEQYDTKKGKVRPIFDCGQYLRSHPKDDLVINAAVGCCYSLLGPRLPYKLQSITIYHPLANTKLYCLVTQAHT